MNQIKIGSTFERTRNGSHKVSELIVLRKGNERGLYDKTLGCWTGAVHVLYCKYTGQATKKEIDDLYEEI